MKRIKSCIECEFCTINGCENGFDCPITDFSGGDYCNGCNHQSQLNEIGEFVCSLDFELFDCEHGVKNPLPEETLKKCRKGNKIKKIEINENF